MFNPTRLTLARERRGLTKATLAEQTGLTVRSISNFENKLEFAPSDETLRKLSEALHFPVGFFLGETLDQPRIGTASFRSLRSIKAARQHSVLAAGALVFCFDEWIDAKFKQPAPDLPELPDEDPTVAASIVRSHWGLAEMPIKNMIHLLEVKGVRVYSLGNQPREISAYSQWYDAKPFIFVNNSMSSEHVRFTLAHEIAHLVLHRDVNPSSIDSRELESQADNFASSFLMPLRDVLANVPRTPTRQSLIRAKLRWKISVTALAYRMHDLGILSDWHYRTLCIEMSKKGDRTREPEGIPHESSLRLAKIFAALRDEGITRADIAEDLAIYPDDLDALVFGLTHTLIENEAVARSAPRARLRVVK